MGKIIAYTAMSLDGFVAGPQGELDWLPQEGDFGYEAFVADIGCTLMGANTYRTILGFGGEFPYADKTNYVFSRSLTQSSEPSVQFVPELSADFLKELCQREKQNIWLVGGGQLNAAVAQMGLIDELWLFVIPRLLGRGIGLWNGQEIGQGFETTELRILEQNVVFHRLKRSTTQL